MQKTAFRKAKDRLLENRWSEDVLQARLNKEEILVVQVAAMLAHPHVTAAELQSEVLVQIPVHANRQVFFLTSSMRHPN